MADKSFSGSVELNFTVYGGTGTRTNQNAAGTLVITTGRSPAVTSRYVGNIRDNTTPNTALQINANDIARLFRKYTSGGSLQYLTLTSVPSDRQSILQLLQCQQVRRDADAAHRFYGGQYDFLLTVPPLHRNMTSPS